MGPVAMPSMGVGYPDGDSRPTVTMDYRRTYTFSPDTNGRISFGLATGYHGCMIKGWGAMETNVGFVPSYFTPNGTFTTEATAHSLTEGQTGLIPIVNPDNVSVSPFRAYRPIVAVAEVTFTGSSMENGGSVVIAKTSTANPPDGTYGTDNLAKTNYAQIVAQPVMSGTSVVGPARDSYVSRVVPADPEFIPYQLASVSASAASPALVTNALVSTVSSGTVGRKVSSLPCPQAGAVWYEYSGLHNSATITVSVRYCCQYSVDGQNIMVPLAKPSPPPPDNPGVLSRMFNAVTNSPAALSLAANTVGHLVPASRPFLAIAAEAYNNS